MLKVFYNPRLLPQERGFSSLPKNPALFGIRIGKRELKQ
jgi:hypothetical protein